MNVLVLWLILRRNYNKYIYLCKFCHICIAKLCFKGVDSKKIADNPYDTLSDYQSENTLFTKSRKALTMYSDDSRSRTLEMSVTKNCVSHNTDPK